MRRPPAAEAVGTATDDEEANGEIQEIRRIYKRDFEQEPVLRVDSREQVSF